MTLLQNPKISLWAYAAHPCGYFSFTRKVSKSVSKGLPLRYPLRLKIFQNLLKNGTTVPFLGTMARNFIFPQSITLSCPHSHSVTFPLVSRKFHVSPGGSKGAEPPSVGGRGTNRFLVNLWILSFHKKVSPGCRGGEPPCKRNRLAETSL